jgi:hypothetical protein
MFTKGSPVSMKDLGTNPNTWGFNNIPATIYPEIFGNETFAANSPSKKPAKMIIPVINSKLIGIICSEI